MESLMNVCYINLYIETNLCLSRCGSEAASDRKRDGFGFDFYSEDELFSYNLLL